MFMQDKIWFENNRGNKISAILSTPVKGKNISIILLCHGLNSEKDSTTNIALEKVFLKNNIATFRFDFFAHGESEGKIEDRNLNEFVENILKAIDYVKSQGYKNIGICGTSFGGVASVIAASKSSDLKVMALKAAGMGQTSRKMSNYKKDFDTKSWIKAGTKVKIPTLIIHGTADEDVEVELGIELAKSIKTSKIQLFKEADHKFTKKKDFAKMIKTISEFIIKTIQIGEHRVK